ncbi:GntR family transcriptional regulator [Deinococcus sp.]|uniref:GntR family transcriptional regulator n=1 Tax=Deinococcus sp. TaxID=47478 RepID=UPI003CC5BE3E
MTRPPKPRSSVTSEPLKLSAADKGSAADMAPALHSAQPLSLADHVYERVHDEILTGALSPGSRVVELDIASRMGTSQGPVREALQRLAREGLVVRHARSSTFVAAVSDDEMYEVFETRALIEAFVVRQLAGRIGDPELAAARQMAEKMVEAAARDDLLELVKWDRRFHRQLVEWSGRETLLRAWDPLYTQIQRFIVQNHRPYYADVLEIARGHGPLLDALINHDVEAAAAAMRAHVMDVWTRMATPPSTS